MRQLLLCISLFLISIAAIAQESTSEPLITDRPTQSASAFLLTQGQFQIETGYLFTDTDFGLSVNSFAAALRYGISDKLELNFIQGAVKSRLELLGGSSSSDLEFVPTTIGLRAHLFDAKGALPQASLLATVSGGLLSDVETGTEYAIRFNMSHSIGENWSLGYNFGAGYYDEGDSVTGLATFVVGRTIAGGLSAFAEIYGFFPDFAQSTFEIDYGLTYLINNDMQVDIYTGTGVSDSLTSTLFGLGFSVRIPKK